MHSRLWMLFCGVVVVLSLASAGAASARGGNHSAFWLGVLGVSVLVFGYGREKMLAGAQPLTSLKPGRTYRVEAILPDQHGFRREQVARLVLSWHVDYGHYEFRLAHLDRDRLERPPVVGDILVGQNMEYGGMSYSVQPDPSASGSWS